MSSASAPSTRWHHDHNETAPPWGELNQTDGGGEEGYAHIDLAYKVDLSDKLNLRARGYADHYLYTDTNRDFTSWVCGTVPTPCNQAAPAENWRYGGELTGNLDCTGRRGVR